MSASNQAQRFELELATGRLRAVDAPGALYDTELGYPAAMFGGASRIHGRVYALDAALLDDALAHLDDVEGAVRGKYARVTVETASGHTAWAYQCGEAALLVRRIEGGDWLLR